MSVTIVSALPQTSSAPQANGVESMAGSDGGSITFAFADILLGKQLTNLAGKPGETLLSGDSGDTLTIRTAAKSIRTRFWPRWVWRLRSPPSPTRARRPSRANNSPEPVAPARQVTPPLVSRQPAQARRSRPNLK